jgi:hypothetical protein
MLAWQHHARRKVRIPPNLATAIPLRNGFTDHDIRAVVQLGVYNVLSNG